MWVDALADRNALSQLRLGKGMQQQDLSFILKRQFVTAIFGACFYANTRTACDIAIDYLAPFFSVRLEGDNPKSELQKYSQTHYHVTPVYAVASESGPDHNKQFVVDVRIPGLQKKASGRGGTKKAAEQDAAMLFLQAVGKRPEQLNYLSSRAKRADWTLARWLKDVSRPVVDRTQVEPLVKDLRRHIGVDVSRELAEIAVAHASIRQTPGHFGGKENGLTLLGNVVYSYAILSELLRRRTPAGLPMEHAYGPAKTFVSTLDSNRYKLRFSRTWSKYIVIRSDLRLRIPQSILVDAFESLLGAAVLHDLTNVDAITEYLCNGIGPDADFDNGTVSQDVASRVLNSGKSLLQQVYQRFGPPDNFRLEKKTEVTCRGPDHNSVYVCRMKGDNSGAFVGEASTKATAVDMACRKVLLYLGQHVTKGSTQTCKVAWIDRMISNINDGLFLNPREVVWLTLPIRNPLLALPDALAAVADAVRSSSSAASDVALQAIERCGALEPLQKEHLCKFVQSLSAGRESSQVLQVVQRSFQKLLDTTEEGGAEHAVNILCSCLFALKCLGRHGCQIISLHDIAMVTLATLRPKQSGCAAVPARFAYVDRERLGSVLAQLQSSSQHPDEVRFTLNESSSAILEIRGWQEIADHEPLVRTAWDLCKLDASGFSVRQIEGGCDLVIPLVEHICVSPEGIAEPCERQQKGWTGGTAEGKLDPQVASVLTALHEIKNRIIAYPNSWREELAAYAAGLRQIAEIVRAPRLTRIKLEAAYEVLCTAMGDASAASATKGRLDVLYEDDIGYGDEAMMMLIFRNIINNASRAAQESGNGVWGVEGTITGDEIDVTVWNTCSDISNARANIEGGGTGKTTRFGTGIGLPTIRRLMAKLLGRLDFEFTADCVRTRVCIPVDLVSASTLITAM